MTPRVVEKLEENDEGLSPVNYVVKTAAQIAKSTSLLMGHRVPSGERGEAMLRQIKHARHMFNHLCNVVGFKGRQASLAASVVGEAGAEQADTAGQGLGYSNVTLRPNMHVAMHYPAIAEEYAMPSNCNTLTGENLHRYVILVSLLTLGPKSWFWGHFDDVRIRN
jgi:hypothetical protein